MNTNLIDLIVIIALSICLMAFVAGMIFGKNGFEPIVYILAAIGLKLAPSSITPPQPVIIPQTSANPPPQPEVTQ